KLLDRKIHIISANMHSVMNTLYASQLLNNDIDKEGMLSVFEELSHNTSGEKRKKIEQYALKKGMYFVEDESGTNIDVQIFDTGKLNHPDEKYKVKNPEKAPVIVVMDYAFGEQAYETMDELLKPFDYDGVELHLDVASISIMGKAGILEGKKGDIMIPNAHLFEGTADNYPFKNELKKKDFEGQGVKVYKGPMITVLGTS